MGWRRVRLRPLRLAHAGGRAAHPHRRCAIPAGRRCLDAGDGRVPAHFPSEGAIAEIWRHGFLARRSGVRCVDIYTPGIVEEHFALPNHVPFTAMVLIDTQLSASEVLRAFHHDEPYLILGAAFSTVAIVAIGYCVLRRRFDALVIWMAIFAYLYGQRL